MNPRPQVSVIVAARNSAATIGKCVAALAAQLQVKHEIIVVCDGSTDETLTIARSFDGVEVIELDWGGPSRARNTGVRAARGEIVAFTDADCVAAPRWLAELCRCFTDIHVAGAGGDQVSPADESLMGRRVQEFFKTIGFMTDYIKSGNSGTAIRETTHNPSCNSAYRKELFEQVGGFSEDQFPGEDVELDLKLKRLGHKLVYNPEAVVGHYRPQSHQALASMMRRYGAGERRLVQKFGFLRRLDFQPFALLLAIIVQLTTAIQYPATWPLLFAPWIVAWGCFCWKTGSLAKGFQFTSFLTIVIINWNWGFIRGDRRSPARPNGTSFPRSKAALSSCTAFRGPLVTTTPEQDSGS